MAALFHQRDQNSDETQIWSRGSRRNGIVTEKMTEAQAFRVYRLVADRLQLWHNIQNFSMLTLDTLCEMDKRLDVFPILKFVPANIREAFKSLEVLSEQEMRSMPVDVFAELTEYLCDLTLAPLEVQSVPSQIC